MKKRSLIAVLVCSLMVMALISCSGSKTASAGAV